MPINLNQLSTLSPQSPQSPRSTAASSLSLSINSDSSPKDSSLKSSKIEVNENKIGEKFSSSYFNNSTNENNSFEYPKRLNSLNDTNVPNITSKSTRPVISSLRNDENQSIETTSSDTQFDEGSMRRITLKESQEDFVPSRRPLRTHTSLSRSESSFNAPLTSPVHLSYRELSNNNDFLSKSDSHVTFNGSYFKDLGSKSVSIVNKDVNRLSLSNKEFNKNQIKNTYDELSGSILKRRESSKFNIPLMEVFPVNHSSGLVSTKLIDKNIEKSSLHSFRNNYEKTRDILNRDTEIQYLGFERDLQKKQDNNDSFSFNGIDSVFHKEFSKSSRNQSNILPSSNQISFSKNRDSFLNNKDSNRFEKSKFASSRDPEINDSTHQSCFQRRRSVSPLKTNRVRLETIQEALEEQYLRVCDRIDIMDRDIREKQLKKEEAEMERDRIKNQIEEVALQMRRLEEEIEHESKINTALRLVNHSQNTIKDQTMKFNLQSRNRSLDLPNDNRLSFIVCSYENFRDGRVTLFDLSESESVHCRQHEKASFFIKHPILSQSFISATYSSLEQHDAFTTDNGLQIQTRRFEMESDVCFNSGSAFGDSQIITCGRTRNTPCVKIWDLSNRECIHTFVQKNESVLDPLMKCTTLASRALIGTSCRDGTLTIWDVESGTILSTWKKNEPKGLIKSIIFDQETPLLFSVVENGSTIDCWDYREPNYRPTFSLECDDKQYRFNHLCLDSSRHRILTGGDALHKWDLIMRRPISRFECVNGPVKQLELLPIGDILVLEDENLMVIQSSSGIVQSQYAFDSNVVCSVNQVLVM